MIKFDEDGCVDLIGIFPSVVTFRVTLPFDEVLQGFVMSPSPVAVDLFHFVFFIAINQIRGRSGEIWSMRWCFNIRPYQTGVEYQVNAPLDRELELHGHWQYDFVNFEGSMLSGGQFDCPIG
jgi:hypothetical protein